MSKQFYFEQVILAYVQFSSIWPNQVQPLRARMNLGAMSMKEYSRFLKAPALLEPHHQVV